MWFEINDKSVDLRNLPKNPTIGDLLCLYPEVGTVRFRPRKKKPLRLTPEQRTAVLDKVEELLEAHPMKLPELAAAIGMTTRQAWGVILIHVHEGRILRDSEGWISLK